MQNIYCTKSKLFSQLHTNFIEGPLPFTPRIRQKFLSSFLPSIKDLQEQKPARNMGIEFLTIFKEKPDFAKFLFEPL